MRQTKEDLEREFTCPKCRCKGALVQEVQLGKSVARMLPFASGRYWAASCSLCGFTELYCLAIVEKIPEENSQVAAQLVENAEG